MADGESKKSSDSVLSASEPNVFTKTIEKNESTRDEPLDESIENLPVADTDASSSRVFDPEEDEEELRVFQDDFSSASTLPETDDKAGKPNVFTKTTEENVPTTDEASRDELVENPLVGDEDVPSSRESGPEEDGKELRVFQDDAGSASTSPEIDDKAGKPDVFMKTNEENVPTVDELSRDAPTSRVSSPKKDGEEPQVFQHDASSGSKFPQMDDKAGKPNVCTKTTEVIVSTTDESARDELVENVIDKDAPLSRVSGPEKDGAELRLFQDDTSSASIFSEMDDEAGKPNVFMEATKENEPTADKPSREEPVETRLDADRDEPSSSISGPEKDEEEELFQIDASSSSTSPEIVTNAGQNITVEVDVHCSSEGAPAKKPRIEPDYQKPGPSKPKGKTKLIMKTTQKKVLITDESTRDELADRESPSSIVSGPEKVDEDLIQVEASSSSSLETVDKTESQIETVSPTMKQWCEFKKEHSDAVILFKKGDFYELLHMDALLAVKLMKFTLLEGEFDRCHFPQCDYHTVARTLLQSGHKIVRVEETETTEMMILRCAKISNLTESDKVIQREVCQIASMATCLFNAQMPDPFCFLPNYIYAICMTDSLGFFVFGVCFIETSMRKVTITQFEDDANFTRLLTLLTLYPPDMILLERGGDIGSLNSTLTGHFRNVPIEKLSPYTEFLSAIDTMVILSRACYFRDSDGSIQWPEIFGKITDNRIPKCSAEYAIKSLGACVWYLQKSKIDINVFTCATFAWYEPLDVLEDKNEENEFMILDFNTINSLNLIGENEESLNFTLDRCQTAFGKRELQMCILKPLCNVNRIKKRQEAVLELHRNENLLNNARTVLNKIPDLERLLPKIYDYGNKFIATIHPDSRAILNEDELSKVKTRDFLKALTAFENANEIVNIFAGCKDSLLKEITQVAPHGRYPDLMPTIESLKGSFDMTKTKKYGKLIPKEGGNDEFDFLEKRLKDLLKESADYIYEMSAVLGCNVEYYETETHPILIKIPENRCHLVADMYELICIVPGDIPARLYSTPYTKTLSEDVQVSEGKLDDLLLNLNSCWYQQFSQMKRLFDTIIQSLTALDVLCSMADYARTCTRFLCIPDIRHFEGRAILAITNSHQPCGEKIDQFVPNDIKLGVEDRGRLKIIIGPEVSGKSTLLRQIGLTCILAHMGSLVPADCCVLTVMDRVCSRVGVYNESIQTVYPFVSEMGEICTVLTRTTERSLILIDEIGKGSLPKDFVGIANVFIMKLLHSMCRVILSTHCHAVALGLIENRNVGVANMACVMALDEHGIEQVASFLYKLHELEM